MSDEPVEPGDGPGIELVAQGDGAPPRINGELVFDAPWQSRAFGLAAALAEAGRLDWSDFQAELIDRVARADSDGSETGDPGTYWRCWLDSLAGLVTGSGLVGCRPGSVTETSLADRSTQVAQAWAHDH